MPTPTNTVPNPDNYYSGKGIMYFKREGETEFRDLGNCPMFDMTPAVQRLEHYSARNGIRVKDQSLVSSRQLTCRITMDEVTADNLALALMTTPVAAGSPSTDHYDYSMDIMVDDEVRGAVRFVGKNAVGAPIQVDLPVVTFAPGQAITLIQEQYGNLEITGEVSADPTTGSFGKVYWNITQEINL